MHHPSIEPLESRIAPAALLSINDAKVVEGDPDSSAATPDTVTLTFTATLSEPSSEATTFNVTTLNGTAVAGEDFNGPATNQLFRIAAGQTSVTVPVTVRSDLFFESTESLFVEIRNPSPNVTVLDGEGRGSIYNDDLQRVDLQTIRYVDADGDLATVRITQGVLTTSGAGAVLSFSPTNSVGGRTLETIDFTGNTVTFNHTSLFVTAAPQPGFSASGGVSDGHADVGEVRAAIPQGSTFQFIKNIDLNTVLIEGDLGKIVAGDAFADDRAVENLIVRSHGVRGTATGAPDNRSFFLGGATAVTVNGDVQGQLNSIGSDRGDFDHLKITGALRGGTAAESGRVFFTGTLANAMIGAIIGGSGANSGTVAGNTAGDTIVGEAEIGVVRVLGDIVGGAGEDSGTVQAPTIGAAIVGSKTAPGDVAGGSGKDSGGIAALAVSRVAITGDLVGAGGTGSGVVFGSAGLGAVKVRGSLLGGGGTGAGAVISDGSINSVRIFKNVAGADGVRSGTVRAGATLNFLQIGAVGSDATDGNLLGGAGAESGRVQAGGDLRAGLIVGSIVGGTANFSGGIAVDGTLGILQIQKNLQGGSAGADEALTNTGYVTVTQIGRLLIDGDLKSGTDHGGGLLSSGTVRAVGEIGELRIGGDIVGNASARVVISAAGEVSTTQNQTIRFLSVDGDTSFADIAGGYGLTASTAKPLGDALNPDAQIGTVKFGGAVAATNVIAGVVPGADGRFGTPDDAVIAGMDNAAVRSAIAQLVIKGAIVPNAEVYGVVAQVITAAKVGGVAVPLNPAGRDDVALGGAATNFRLHELAKPA